jgi:hypothetical protein
LLGQEAPLTPEYQAIYEANLADHAAGGQGIESTFTCLSPGMPRVMLAYAPMEIVVTSLCHRIGRARACCRGLRLRKIGDDFRSPRL